MNPNFLVAGVAKCGTTSLYYYLEQHPQVCIPKKETFFFIADRYKTPPVDERGRRDPARIIATRPAYDQLYSVCKDGAVGEVSTCYVFYYKEAIPKIKATLGDPAILIVIRQPVERLFSGYKHFLRMEKEDLSLDEALAAEIKRGQAGWDFMWQYTGLGFYADAIEAYQQNFSKVKVILQEDLTDHAEATMKEIFQFIGVDDNFVPDTSTRYNISDPQTKNVWFRYFFRNKIARKYLKPLVMSFITESTKRKIMHSFRKPNKQAAVKLDDKKRNELLTLYKSDILRIEKLTGRNLNHWLK